MPATQTSAPAAVARVPEVPTGADDPMNYQDFAVTNDGVMFFFSQVSCCPKRRAPPRCWSRAPRWIRCWLDPMAAPAAAT